MYPVGVLFGLGCEKTAILRALQAVSFQLAVLWQFKNRCCLYCAVDTATEVALLAISAAAPGQGIPIYWILLLPSLFTAAMAMIDTLDGILMVSSFDCACCLPLIVQCSCSSSRDVGPAVVGVRLGVR